MNCPNCGAPFEKWKSLVHHWQRGCPVTLLERYAKGVPVEKLAAQHNLSISALWTKIKLGSVLKHGGKAFLKPKEAEE